MCKRALNMNSPWHFPSFVLSYLLIELLALNPCLELWIRHSANRNMYGNKKTWTYQVWFQYVWSWESILNPNFHLSYLCSWVLFKYKGMFSIYTLFCIYRYAVIEICFNKNSYNNYFYSRSKEFPTVLH